MSRRWFIVALLLVASLGPSQLARAASRPTGCPGTVTVSYGHFSHLEVTVVSCGYARAFVRISGGVPRGWACTSKRSGKLSTNSCRNGRERISYQFVST